MQNTPENFKIIAEQFEKLCWMPKYPEEPRALEQRILRLMKIVRNKGIQDCILEGCVENQNRPAAEHFVWDKSWNGGDEYTSNENRHSKTFGSPDRNDLDWLIDTIGERCEELPTQLGIRRIYCSAGLRPADGKSASELETE